jgi:prolipoprotein diacylglyceryltransferase
LGNFVNQELYGPPISQCGNGFPPCLPWGIQIDAAHRVGTPWDAIAYPVATTQFVPMFAYEAILNLIGLAVVLWIARRFAARLYDGDIALIYIMWYGAVRSLLEGYRTGNWYIGPLPTAVWIGVAGIILAGGFLILRHLRGWGTPGAWMHRTDQTDADAGASSSANAEPQPG